MPLKGGRYRVKTTSSGKKIRLHFTPGGGVNEAKNLGTGKVHTPAEFAADRAKKKRSNSKVRSFGGM
jgi:hypothetical protein